MLNLAIFLSCIIAIVNADIYMHNPRGSNDRNCERNDNRNNGNRLFDSQNNDKGGYACPRAVGGPEVVTDRMYYYSESKLQVEWTAQHGCQNSNVKCQLIFQYMCSPSAGSAPASPKDPMWMLLNPWIRDGTPTDANDAATDRMDTGEEMNLRYGYHELSSYYTACNTRSRNQGLWLNDQTNIGTTATSTRQQENANREGWECQEERDYYPYWHPSPWKDIAVLTTDQGMCGYYKSNSQNVMAKYWCLDGSGNPLYPNQQGPCLQANGVWTEVPAWGIDAPYCGGLQWSRDNALSNVPGGELASYMWTIPKTSTTWENCVLRLRYNISNANVDFWLDASYNNANSPIVPTNPRVHIYGVDTPNAAGTGYTFGAMNVSMKINGNQYGRTFQDRSYVFNIMARNDPMSKALEGTTVWNLNMRGKRGNIVQTFPAVEYDFTPRLLTLNVGDYVHFQWTGSDYNPNRNPNDGIGGPEDPANANNYRADRSNAVPIQDKWMQPGVASGWFGGSLSNEQMVSLAYMNQDITKCLTYDELFAKNGGDADQIDKDNQNCMKLNAKTTPYYDIGAPVMMKKPGYYPFICTRNNNFSNRNSKGHIYVTQQLSSTEKAAIGVGTVFGVGALAGGGYYGYAKWAGRK